VPAAEPPPDPTAPFAAGLRQRLEASEALRRSVLDSALDAVVAADGESRAIEFNRAAERIFGHSRDEVLGRNVIALLTRPDQRQTLLARLAEYQRTADAEILHERIELTGVRADGSEFPMEIAISPAVLDDGSRIFTACMRDVGERRDAAALLSKRAGQQAAVAELGERALAANSLGDVMQHAAAAVAGTLEVEAVGIFELMRAENELAPRALVGVPPHEHAAIAATAETSLGYAITHEEPVIVDDWADETRFDPVRIPGREAVASLANVVVHGPDRRPWGVLGAVSEIRRAFDADDVTFMQSVANVVASSIQRDLVDSALRHSALHDALTGLPNRTLFLDRLEHALTQSERRRRTVAVIFLDLDRFKLVNDSLGHQAGDDLLRATTERIGEVLRPEDTLARFAGDEFVVLCMGLRTERDATAVADRLAQAFARPFRLGECDRFVSASMGIAMPGRNGQTAEELIRDAGAAMYLAKERGRARYELSDERMRVRAMLRMRTEDDLRHALPEKQFEVHYQPIVSLTEADLVGFEALLRWHHPGRGSVPPNEFIGIAEDSGLIGGIGRWVLGEAAGQAARWRGRGGRFGGPLVMSVNVSARQFAEGGLADEIAGVLEQAELQADELAVEITESVLMEETDAAVETLQELKALGVRLMLDDFGTGYSSLSYVERFPLDGLKIDRSFVAALDGGESSWIVAAIVSMARSLELTVTAEGVETEDQVEQLRRLGCDFAQGWYFGRPGPPLAQAPLVEARPARSGPHFNK
jgi:diguanylate cyclase (GGDEF)-like protein/PAS domain S-box-containing protein